MALSDGGRLIDILVVEASGFKVGLLMSEILELLPTEKLQGVKVLDLRHHFNPSIQVGSKKLSSVLLRKSKDQEGVQLLVDRLGDIYSVTPEAIETFPPGVARVIPFWAVITPRAGAGDVVPLMDVPRLLSKATIGGLVR
ncbi:MAG: hypothetical protein COX57_09950 [Alphaproteobacteria bacterium CG_4_10_14_0_2_um_filter_63_37]|nr:MAG: hypothetical protein AUJ55_03975 [Proteobacteria bacterium CG1_02_64_396]PJA24105.1 MAG: hypothetical protein COX57_09950 [Alphaproteobacteria bacterium CG_4_10_14_0_2_um_filter_63_37]